MKRGKILTARRGYDALKCEPRFRTIDSTKNQLKRYLEEQGTFVYEGIAGGVSRTAKIIQHNLGYRPFFQAYAKGPADTAWIALPGTITGTDAADNPLAIQAATTQGLYENLINFYTWDIETPAFGDQNIEYKYVIYIDPTKDAWS